MRVIAICSSGNSQWLKIVNSNAGPFLAFANEKSATGLVKLPQYEGKYYNIARLSSCLPLNQKYTVRLLIFSY
jgi:lipocalin